MNKKVLSGIAIVVSSAIGVATGWYLAKKKYEVIAEDEIKQMREEYDARLEQLNEQQKAIVEQNNKQKEQIAEAKLRIEAEQYQKIRNIYASEEIDDMKEQIKDISNQYERSHPKSKTTYVITPDEFGSNDDYGIEILNFYDDGFVIDRYGIEVEYYEDLIGDATDHFGEYEEDAVYVRNDIRRCDYKVILVGGNYLASSD